MVCGVLGGGCVVVGGGGGGGWGCLLFKISGLGLLVVGFILVVLYFWFNLWIVVVM